MKKMIALFLLFLMLSSPAIARVGETRVQCEARYGPVVKSSEKDMTMHEKAGFTVMCYYHEEKCVSIAFLKVEKDEKGIPLPLSELEMKTLLEVSSGGKTWTPADKLPSKGLEIQCWTAEGLEAGYLGDPVCILTIVLKEHNDRLKDEQAAKEKDKFKGF